MKRRCKVLSSALLLSLATPVAALAQSVAIPPLIRKSADERAIANVTALLSSEFDFRPEYESATELASRPASLTSSCLSSPSCLRGITRGAGTDQLVAGTLAVTQTTFTLDLVLFDGTSGRIVRRQTFSLPNEPEAIADGMDDVVHELITGKTREQMAEEEDELTEFDFADIDDDEDDFDDEALADFDPEEDAVLREEARRRAEEESRRRADEEAIAQAEAEARRRAEEEARRRADEEARRRAEQEARRRADEEARRRAEEEARRRAEEEARRRAEEEARRRAEEQARRSAEEEARRRTEEEARRRAEAEASRDDDEDLFADDDEEFDPSLITFGSVDPDEIEIEELNDLIQFGAPTDIEVDVADDPELTRSYYSDDADLVIADSEVSRLELDLDELDEPERRSRRERTSRERPPRERTGRVDREGENDGVSIALRGGYTSFQVFDFITGGAELGIPIASGVRVVVGLDSYSVHRDVPPFYEPDVGSDTEWNTIFPVNAGVVYRAGKGAFRPYVGADAIAAQYYFDANNKASWAVGARGRLGADIMIAGPLGFNLNAAVGFWQGKDWVIIQRNVKDIGLLPQISGGVVLAF